MVPEGRHLPPGGGGVLGGAGVLGGGLAPMFWSIQLRNFATRANTEYLSFAEHLGEPQLTAPCSTQLPLEFWHTYGPPLSPWQPLKICPSTPAHSIWSVIFSDDPPVDTIMINERGNYGQWRITDQGWLRFHSHRERLKTNTVSHMWKTLRRHRPGEATSFLAHTSLGTGGIWACCRMWCALPGCLILPQPRKRKVDFSVNAQRCETWNEVTVQHARCDHLHHSQSETTTVLQIDPSTGFSESDKKTLSHVFAPERVPPFTPKLKTYILPTSYRENEQITQGKLVI